MVTFYRRLPRFDYLSPQTMDEALSLLSRYNGKARLIAGGTDLLPKLKRRAVKAPSYIIDLKGIQGLDYIKYDEVNGLSIGALATIHSIETFAIVREKYNILLQAAESMASPQVRHRGTIAGNICNAVPSADTAPVLLALEAKVKVLSRQGERIIDTGDFFTGPSETVLNGDEILTEIKIPVLPEKAKGKYLKLSPRQAMDLAVVGVAVLLISENGVCRDIRIALGAVSPTPVRVKSAEEILRGKKLDKSLTDRAAGACMAGCLPISDHRASAEYRREMVKVLAKQAIEACMS
jgi:aerobic carbon-monoxide dehydrogenase medium subunit